MSSYSEIQKKRIKLQKKAQRQDRTPTGLKKDDESSIEFQLRGVTIDQNQEGEDFEKGLVPPILLDIAGSEGTDGYNSNMNVGPQEFNSGQGVLQMGDKMNFESAGLEATEGGLEATEGGVEDFDEEALSQQDDTDIAMRPIMDAFNEQIGEEGQTGGVIPVEIDGQHSEFEQVLINTEDIEVPKPQEVPPQSQGLLPEIEIAFQMNEESDNSNMNEAGREERDKLQAENSQLEGELLQERQAEGEKNDEEEEKASLPQFKDNLVYMSLRSPPIDYQFENRPEDPNEIRKMPTRAIERNAYIKEEESDEEEAEGERVESEKKVQSGKKPSKVQPLGLSTHTPYQIGENDYNEKAYSQTIEIKERFEGPTSEKKSLIRDMERTNQEEDSGFYDTISAFSNLSRNSPVKKGFQNMIHSPNQKKSPG